MKILFATTVLFLLSITTIFADGGGGGGGAGPFGPFPVSSTTGAGGYSNSSYIVQYPLQKLLKFSILKVWEQKNKIVNK